MMPVVRKKEVSVRWRIRSILLLLVGQVAMLGLTAPEYSTASPDLVPSPETFFLRSGPSELQCGNLWLSPEDGEDRPWHCGGVNGGWEEWVGTQPLILDGSRPSTASVHLISWAV